MTETKFTPGPWRLVKEREHHETSSDGHDLAKWGVYDNRQAWCIASTGSTWPTEDEEDANASLVAASPEMYESEEKNLAMLKVILEGYEAMAGVVLSDPDVKAVIEDGTLARQLPCAMPDVIAEIIRELKMRIMETETLLAKARGEARNGR